MYRISAKIRSTTLRQMAGSAADMAAAVVDCARLLRPGVVSVNLDTTVWAEALGCRAAWSDAGAAVAGAPGSLPQPEAMGQAPRVRTVLDGIGRVRGALPAGTLLACGVAGPGTLARMLGLSSDLTRREGFYLGEFVVEAVNLVCASRVDFVVVLEDETVGDREIAIWAEKGHYSRALNIARHFSTTALFHARAAAQVPPEIDEYDGVVAGAAVATELQGRDGAVGIPVPGFGAGDCTAELVRSLLGRENSFLTSSWDLSPDTDLDGLRRDLETVKRSILEW